MSETETRTETMTGSCLCGAVRFTAHDVPQELSACHCSMCRKWGGGPSFAVHGQGPVTIDAGADALVWYGSSDWAERGFCGTCGSNLFYRVKGETPMWFIMAGTLDGFTDLAFTSEIFVDEKPGSYAFAGDRPTMTGAEVFALFAPKDD
jgi:hypothetical protein